MIFEIKLVLKGVLFYHFNVSNSLKSKIYKSKFCHLFPEQWVFAMYEHLLVLRKASLVMMSVLDQAKHCSAHQKSRSQPKS